LVTQHNSQMPVISCNIIVLASDHQVLIHHKLEVQVCFTKSLSKI